jgi:anti-sigma regulatory factor (Ser/Thr protein kinase)
VSGNGPGEAFTIELPAEPAYVATARMFAASLARQVGVGEEVLDDLKLAVSEACARALTSAADGRLRVAATRTEERLMFEVPQGAPRLSREATTEDLAAGLSLELITVLFEDAEIVRDVDGGQVVRFSVPAP